MAYANEHEHPTTDEINLVRLLRRLQKSVANKEEWTPSDAPAPVVVEDVSLRARKTAQTVKFARRLIKTVEIECEDTPPRFKRLNEAKIQLDHIDTFLNNLQKSLERLENVEKVSLLASLPLPVPKEIHVEPSSSAETNLIEDTRAPLDEDEKAQDNPLAVTTHHLTIIPPDPGEVSPSIISTALPSLLPLNPSESARASAFTRTFGPTPTARNVGSNQSTMGLQEELSSQLEQMAQQLKRNAIHFSTSLAKDKAVIEDAATKIESNFDVMQSQRVKLRDRTKRSWSNTCLVVGIVVLVVVVFMLMVMVIRFS